jgi:hypothetical protein
MRRNALTLIAAVILLGGCGGDGSSILGGFQALDSCDYGAACTDAVRKAVAVKDASPELKARLLHVRMNALMKFPAAEPAFLESIGVNRELGAQALMPDLKALESDADPKGRLLADQARPVLEFLCNQACSRFTELEAHQKGGGMFADSATIARISSLIQLLSAVTPENSAYVADVMRVMVGCSLSTRADGAAVMVAAKTMLVDAVGSCPAAGSGDAVFRSVCDTGRKILAEMSLPLPMVESRSGEVASAYLPAGRSTGIIMNPPWMISLSAGRLMVVDQGVVPPDGMEVPANQPTLLLDLRETHRPEDIKTAMHQVLKTRKMWKRPGDERSTWYFMVVDRNTTFADLSEVIVGFMGESDALPLLAVLPTGASRASWMPMNFFIQTRPLFSPDGRMERWGAGLKANSGSGNPVLELTPFSLTAAGKTVEFPREGGAGIRDMRDVNRLASDLVAGGANGAFSLKVSQAVTFELIVSVIGALAYRLPDSAMVSATAFESSQELRDGVGGYRHMLAWPVLERDM